jgi:hypothetical protein
MDEGGGRKANRHFLQERNYVQEEISYRVRNEADFQSAWKYLDLSRQRSVTTVSQASKT